MFALLLIRLLLLFANPLAWLNIVANKFNQAILQLIICAGFAKPFYAACARMLSAKESIAAIS